MSCCAQQQRIKPCRAVLRDEEAISRYKSRSAFATNNNHNQHLFRVACMYGICVLERERAMRMIMLKLA